VRTADFRTFNGREEELRNRRVLGAGNLPAQTLVGTAVWEHRWLDGCAV
jgi:hypothetical protein